MDQSYITHQRRPALIPAGVQLAPEDERAVRLRTGYVDPASRRDSVFFNLCFTQDGSCSAAVKGPHVTAQNKRKASALEVDGDGEGVQGHQSCQEVN